AARSRLAGPRRVSGVDAQQAAAARNAGATAAARRRRSPEAGIHAAVRDVDGARAAAIRPRRARLPRGAAMDRGGDGGPAVGRVGGGGGSGVWDGWKRGGAHWSRPWALGVLGQFLDQMGAAAESA